MISSFRSAIYSPRLTLTPITNLRRLELTGFFTPFFKNTHMFEYCFKKEPKIFFTTKTFRFFNIHQARQELIESPQNAYFIVYKLLYLYDQQNLSLEQLFGFTDLLDKSSNRECILKLCEDLVKRKVAYLSIIGTLDKIIDETNYNHVAFLLTKINHSCNDKELFCPLIPLFFKCLHKVAEIENSNYTLDLFIRFLNVTKEVDPSKIYLDLILPEIENLAKNRSQLHRILAIKLYAYLLNLNSDLLEKAITFLTSLANDGREKVKEEISCLMYNLVLHADHESILLPLVPIAYNLSKDASISVRHYMMKFYNEFIKFNAYRDFARENLLMFSQDKSERIRGDLTFHLVKLINFETHIHSITKAILNLTNDHDIRVKVKAINSLSILVENLIAWPEAFLVAKQVLTLSNFKNVKKVNKVQDILIAATDLIVKLLSMGCKTIELEAKIISMDLMNAQYVESGRVHNEAWRKVIKPDDIRVQCAQKISNSILLNNTKFQY